MNHQSGESVRITDGVGMGVPVPPDAANANTELARALLKIYSVVTGLSVVKVPDEIVQRWAAEEATGAYTMGVPGRETRTALALIVAAGRFLVNGKGQLDRTVVVALLQEAAQEILPAGMPRNE